MSLKRSHHVLIVDDEELNRRLLAEMLEETGNYTVDEAENGKIAWHKVHDNKYDLIITDIRMPEMDGLELLQLVKDYNSKIPIIIVTAFASIETAVEALQKGASNFLKKPFSIDEIASVTTKALRSAEHCRKTIENLENLSKSFSVTTKGVPSVIDPLFNQVRELAKPFGFTDSQLHMNLYLSLSEAVANAIEHGNNSDTSKNITVEATGNEKGITVSIEDEGPGFNLSLVPDPTEGTNISKPNGRGIFLMKCYMNSVVYENNGAKVTLTIEPDL